MEKFDVEIKKSVSSSEPLPAGGYVAKIMGAKVDKYTWGEVLVISFDIAEGEHKGFFAKQYRANTNEDKKWKGNFRLTIPQENDQYAESNKRTFGNAIWAIEESNPGYHWAWEEDTLKDKLVGVLFRNREWAIEDAKRGWSRGWTTECCTFISADEVRSGEFKMPNDKPLSQKDLEKINGAVGKADNNSSFKPLIDIEDDDDLPF